MLTVQSAVVLSLAAFAEGLHLQGLLQGMHLDGLKGQVDSLGMVTLDASNTAKSNLMKTAEALENLVRRVAAEKAPPDGALKEAVTAFHTTLQSYDDDLARQISQANAELANKSKDINACDATPFAVNTSGITSAESALDTAHATWNDAKTDLTTKETALSTFVSTITSGTDCTITSGTDGEIRSYFANLETIAGRKADYESKKAAHDAAVGVEATAVTAVNSAKAQHQTAVCTARIESHQTCLNYAVCMRDTKSAHVAKEASVTQMSAALTSEAQVIKKSKCYVNLLVNHAGGALDATSCSSGADGQLSEAELAALRLAAPSVTLDTLKECTGLSAVVAMDSCAAPGELSNSTFTWEACPACPALADTGDITITGDVITLPTLD